MTTYTTTDVLICGAGVTGLTLAIELARHGVSFRLIEKRATPFTGSRDKGIQPRTQEIFEDIGILNKVVAAGGLYPRLRTYRHDGSYVDSDIAHNTKPTHAEPLASFAGRISFTGWPKQETSLPTNLITYKELDLRGSRTSAGEFDEALRMLSTLEINPQDVVSKVVNLDEIPDAVKELDRYPERYLKINAVFH